jgi:hypothetical protein
MRAETRDKWIAAGAALGGLGLIIALVVALNRSKQAPASSGGSSGLVPKGNRDPWGDLKTSIGLLELAASNLRADAFVNHPTVWQCWLDAVGNAGVDSAARNLMSAPDGTPLNPPALQAGLTELDAAMTKLFQDTAAASVATLVPASTKALVAALASATLNVSRAAFSAGAG